MCSADLLGGSHRVLVAHGEAALFIATRNAPYPVITRIQRNPFTGCQPAGTLAQRPQEDRQILEPSLRCRNRRDRALTAERHPPQHPPLRRIEVGPGMQGTAIVPDQEIAGPPDM